MLFFLDCGFLLCVFLCVSGGMLFPWLIFFQQDVSAGVAVTGTSFDWARERRLTRLSFPEGLFGRDSPEFLHPEKELPPSFLPPFL